MNNLCPFVKIKLIYKKDVGQFSLASLITKLKFCKFLSVVLVADLKKTIRLLSKRSPISFLYCVILSYIIISIKCSYLICTFFQAGKFSPAPLFTNLGAGLALLGVVRNSVLILSFFYLSVSV